MDHLCPLLLAACIYPGSNQWIQRDQQSEQLLAYHEALHFTSQAGLISPVWAWVGNFMTDRALAQLGLCLKRERQVLLHNQVHNDTMYMLIYIWCARESESNRPGDNNPIDMQVIYPLCYLPWKIKVHDRRQTAEIAPYSFICCIWYPILLQAIGGSQ